MKENNHINNNNEKKIRILNYPWHLAHQYCLYKIPNTEWSWVSQHRRQYNEVPRGDMISKFNIKRVPHYEKGKYDIALLHIDQQCFEENLWQRGKGSVYRELNEVIKDIPKIVINHGTPYYPEIFQCNITKENYKALGYTEKQIGMSRELIDKCKEVIGDNYMVVNSHRAKEEWGFGKHIQHGMDKEEWFDLPKEPRVITTLSPAGLDKYYDRSFLAAIREELQERDIQFCQITVDVNFPNFEKYREFIGRSLIYIHPMKEAPMSRGRSEAMLSGCCVITTPWHDADKFIVNGKNGFIMPRNPKTVCDIIENLVYDYKTAIAIGQKGKETAIKEFNGDNYRQTWREFMEYVIEDYANKSR